MPSHKRPPRGYRNLEHPLPHKFDYAGSLEVLDAAKDATICTLLRSSEDITAIETVEVNPQNANFAEETGCTVANGSIVPRINFTLRASISQVLALDNEFGQVQFHMMPIYTAFLSSMDAADSRLGTQLKDILQLTTAGTPKTVRPTWAASQKLLNGTNQPINTITDVETFSDWGMTTNLLAQSVAWNVTTFYNAMQYYSLQGMLKKVVGPIKTWTLKRDRNALYHSNNFTNPTVKRGNEYMYCAVLLWTSIVGTHSFGHVGDFDAAAKDLIHYNVNVRYDEWNPDFDQTAL